LPVQTIAADALIADAARSPAPIAALASALLNSLIQFSFG
jgi:hypothetical protein